MNVNNWYAHQLTLSSRVRRLISPELAGKDVKRLIDCIFPVGFWDSQGDTSGDFNATKMLSLTHSMRIGMSTNM